MKYIIEISHILCSHIRSFKAHIKEDVTAVQCIIYEPVREE